MAENPLGATPPGDSTGARGRSSAGAGPNGSAGPNGANGSAGPNGGAAATNGAAKGDGAIKGSGATIGAARRVGLGLTVKDFKSDQEVRWCPGCGDYAILAAVQAFLPELGIPRERIVFISGIGCSSRFPYYVNTYGMHSIHGRAPAIATGLSVSRPDLSVWVVTGDGDALSIGGNHLIHALRRNVNLKILLFNNKIYGLTKGQYSPTSELGKITKSTPVGSADSPFNPISLALGAGASFVARTIDTDRKHLTSVLRAASTHRGSAFVEIYQNCNIFNDGAFDTLKEPDTRDDYLIRLEHGNPIRFGRDGEWCVVHPPGGFGLEVHRSEDVGPGDIVVHDTSVAEPAYAFALSRLPSDDLRHSPIGVFRAVSRPSYDDLVRGQLDAAKATLSGTAEAELGRLLTAGDTWTIN
jgi:2-oxoglutarate/2-oxoacid ferredoxin oxidoreductase subunit beta